MLLDKKIAELDFNIQDLYKQTVDDIEANLGQFKDFHEQVPPYVEKMMRTLKEMKIGSEPDETADYWEERTQIDQWIIDLESVKNDISDSQKSF